PAKNGWVTVYDEASDGQNEKVLRSLGEALSKQLDTVVIACLVHDSDIAMYWLFDRGHLVDEFNSAPDYFSKADSKTRARVRGRAEALFRCASLARLGSRWMPCCIRRRVRRSWPRTS